MIERKGKYMNKLKHVQSRKIALYIKNNVKNLISIEYVTIKLCQVLIIFLCQLSVSFVWSFFAFGSEF